jgi:hypothetical protein
MRETEAAEQIERATAEVGGGVANGASRSSTTGRRASTTATEAN